MVRLGVFLVCLAGSVPAQDAVDRQREADAARVAATRLELLHRFTWPQLGLTIEAPGWPDQSCFDGSGQRLCVQVGTTLVTVTIADGTHAAAELSGARLSGPAPAGVFLCDDRSACSADPVHPDRSAPFLQAYLRTGAHLAPDETRVLTSRTLYVREHDAWREVPLDGPGIAATAFDEACGRTAVAFSSADCFGGRSGSGIQVFARDGRKVGTLASPRNAVVTALAFTGDGQRLYCSDPGMRLLDANTRKVLAQDPLQQWSFHLVDAGLAIGHDARALTFWDAVRLRPLKREPIGDPPVHGSPEPSRVRPTELVGQLRYCRSARLLALANGAGLRIWRVVLP